MLRIFQPEDWYTVTVTDLRAIGFPQHVTKVQLATLLGKKYPDHKWEQLFILRGRYIQQRRLEKAVASLFPVLILFYLFLLSFSLFLCVYSLKNGYCREKKFTSTQERRQPLLTLLPTTIWNLIFTSRHVSSPLNIR